MELKNEKYESDSTCFSFLRVLGLMTAGAPFFLVLQGMPPRLGQSEQPAFIADPRQCCLSLKTLSPPETDRIYGSTRYTHTRFQFLGIQKYFLAS